MSEVERLANLKKKLEEERSRLLERVDELNLVIRIIDTILEEKSYVPADKLLAGETGADEERRVTPEVQALPAESTAKKVPMRRKVEVLRWGGRTIAEAEIGPDVAVITVSPEAKVPVDSGPVRYIIRLFDKYVDEDLAKIREGALNSERKFTYIVDEEGGYLSKIEIINYNTESRLRDILGKIRWAVKTLIKETGEGKS